MLITASNTWTYWTIHFLTATLPSSSRHQPLCERCHYEDLKASEQPSCTQAATPKCDQSSDQIFVISLAALFKKWPGRTKSCNHCCHPTLQTPQSHQNEGSPDYGANVLQQRSNTRNGFKLKMASPQSYQQAAKMMSASKQECTLEQEEKTNKQEHWDISVCIVSAP